MFDESPITLPGRDGWAIVDDAAELLTGGVTKAELESGDYTPRAWQLAREGVEAFERSWARMRGGAWFRLVVWLAQRDEDAVAERLAAEKETKSAKKQRGKAKPKRERNSARADGGRDSRPEKVVSGKRGQRDQALGSYRDKDAKLREAGTGSRGVAHNDAKGPEPERGQAQLRLFD